MRIADFRRVGCGLLIAALAAGLGACGADGELDSLSLTLRFSPQDMPPGTTRLTIYILPSIVTINEPPNPPEELAVSCDLFVGPTADRFIVEFTSYLVKRPIQVQFSPTEETAVSVKDLPVGLLVFVVEALDASGPVALGCGKGQIERGKKKFIPIYMEPTP